MFLRNMNGNMTGNFLGYPQRWHPLCGWNRLFQPPADYRRVIRKCWNFQTRPRKVMQIYGTPVMSPRTTLMSTLDVYLHLGKVTINQWIYWVPPKKKWNIVIWFTLFLGFHHSRHLQLRHRETSIAPPDPPTRHSCPAHLEGCNKHGINRIRIDDWIWLMPIDHWINDNGLEGNNYHLRLSLIMGVDQK